MEDLLTKLWQASNIFVRAGLIRDLTTKWDSKTLKLCAKSFLVRGTAVTGNIFYTPQEAVALDGFRSPLFTKT